MSRKIPTPRDTIIGVFLELQEKIVPVPSLVRAYLLAFFRARHTQEHAWASLTALERLGVLRLKAGPAALMGARDAALCPRAEAVIEAELPEDLKTWVFCEAELLLSLDEARSLSQPERRRAAREPLDDVAGRADLRRAKTSSRGSYAARVAEALEEREAANA